MEKLTGTKYILCLVGIGVIGVLIAETGVLALIGIVSLGTMITSLLLTGKRAQAIGWHGGLTAGLYFLFAILSMVLPLLLLINLGLILTLTFKNGNKETK